jgi:hypothetical protein
VWRFKGLGVGFAYPYPKLASCRLRGVRGFVREYCLCGGLCVRAFWACGSWHGVFIFSSRVGAGAQRGLARVLLLSAVSARLVASLTNGEIMKKYWLDLAGERPEISESRDMLGFVLRSIGIVCFVLSLFALVSGRGSLEVFAPMIIAVIAIPLWLLAWYPIPKKYLD